MDIPVVENVLKLNDQIAAANRERFNELGVRVIDLIGAPGCGKTALLEATLAQLSGELAIGILVGDLATTRDAERLLRHGEQVVQINTGRGCHLDANQVQQGAERLDLAKMDLLIIENVGNLICPVGFDLGQHAKVGMFSVTEGDDKPAKHPHLVNAADRILLNKMDLMPHMRFDLDRFDADVAALNGKVAVTRLAATSPDDPGLAEWLNFLRTFVAAPTA